MKKTAYLFLSFFLPLALLAACGGSGSGIVVAPPPPPPTDWQPGVFLDDSTFAARCQSPRSGIDPATNSPYPDVQGITTDENNFLRSFSNNTYLWYDEITDRDPSLYNDPLAYFDLLKTTDTTPSGAAKDQFHFTYDSEEWFQLSQSGVSAGYGIRLPRCRGHPPASTSSPTLSPTHRLQTCRCPFNVVPGFLPLTALTSMTLRKLELL